MSKLTPIKYVGKRPTYIDGMYGTRTAFVQGETAMVDADIAVKMLRHTDQYQPGIEAGASPAVESKPVTEKDEDTQDLRDQINIMDKHALKQMAWERYQQRFSGNPSVESLRAKVTQLVDQFGAL